MSLIDSSRLAAFKLGFHGRQFRSILEEGVKGVLLQLVPDVHPCRRAIEDAVLILADQFASMESEALRTALRRASELHDLACGVSPEVEGEDERGTLAKMQQDALERTEFLLARVDRRKPTLGAWREVGTALADLRHKVSFLYEGVPIPPDAWGRLNGAVDRLPVDERGLAAPFIFGMEYRSLNELAFRIREAYDDICQCLSTPDPPVEQAEPSLQDDPDQRETPPVELRGHGKPPLVRGVNGPMLTKAQYNVVKALLDAGPAGLSKDELENKSCHTDARKILKRLHDSDSNWAMVIHMAQRSGGRYRIL